MELNDQLKELVSEISPTDSQQSALRDAHIRLRERLMADDDLKPLIVETFLQGSYRRHTSIRPQSDDKPDVDVVVVTRVDRHKFTPEQAMNLLIPFLNRHYAGKWKKKGRSIGIEMADVKLDVVLTSAPSETEEKTLLSELAQEYTYGLFLGGAARNGKVSPCGSLTVKPASGSARTPGSRSGGRRTRTERLTAITLQWYGWSNGGGKPNIRSRNTRRATRWSTSSVIVVLME